MQNPTQQIPAGNEVSQTTQKASSLGDEALLAFAISCEQDAFDEVPPRGKNNLGHHAIKKALFCGGNRLFVSSGDAQVDFCSSCHFTPNSDRSSRNLVPGLVPKLIAANAARLLASTSSLTSGSINGMEPSLNSACVWKSARLPKDD